MKSKIINLISMGARGIKNVSFIFSFLLWVWSVGYVIFFTTVPVAFCQQRLAKAAEIKEVDLQITFAASPQQATPGDTIDYTIQYRNLGTSAASNVVITAFAANHSAGVYYTTFVFGSSDPPHSNIIFASGNKLQSIEWRVSTLPPAMTQSNVIKFKARIDPALSESKALTATAAIRADNFAASEVPTTVFVRAPVIVPSDIIFSKMVSSSSPHCAGAVVEFLISVENRSSEATINNLTIFDVIPAGAVFVFSNPNFTSMHEDTLFWENRQVPSNSRLDIIVGFSFANAGSYTNIAGGAVDDLELPQRSVSFSVQSLPDLLPISLSCVGTQESNQLVPVSAVVRNQGGCSVTNVQAAFYEGSPEGQPIGVGVINFLDAGEEQTVFINWSAPAEGEYVLFVRVDHLEQIPESDEANNLFTSSCPVCFGPPPSAPQLSVTPATIEPNETVTISIQPFSNLNEQSLIAKFSDGTQRLLFLPPLFPDAVTQIQFSDTRLRGREEREQIIFELKTVDECGFENTTSAVLNIAGANDYLLAANVFHMASAGSVEIRFKLSSNRTAELKVLDISGRVLKNYPSRFYSAGWNIESWDGKTDQGQAVGSGVYIVTIDSGALKEWRKIIVVQ